MFYGIKKWATRRTLAALVLMEIFLAVVGAAIKIAVFDEYASNYYPEIRLLTLFSNILGLIPAVVLLLSVISNREALFKASLIVGIAISFFNDVLSPGFAGQAFGNVYGNAIRLLILSLPIVFIIIDCFRGHKWNSASCVISVVMLVLQALALLTNFYHTMEYFLNSYTVCFSAKALVHWTVILLYLARFAKPKKITIKETPVSIEEKLQIAKQKYDSGEMTQEEYRAQKAEILKKV